MSWIAVPPYISSPSLTWRFAYAACYFCKHYFSSTFYWLLQSNKRVSKAFIRELAPTSLSPVLSSEDTQIALRAAIAIFSLAEENRGCDLAWISAMFSSRKLHLRLGRRLTWFRAIDNSQKLLLHYHCHCNYSRRMWISVSNKVQTDEPLSSSYGRKAVNG